MSQPAALPTPLPRILIAGVGNTFLQDDGFGPEVARRLRERDVPDHVSVFDFGTGGLNLAYEVMRGYDALILVDVSRRGGEPGTLYLIETEEDDVGEGIQDGDVLDPHAADPASVLRFVKTLAGWPGRVLVVACEPAEVGDVGIGLSDAIEPAVGRAIAMIEETIAELEAGRA